MNSRDDISFKRVCSLALIAASFYWWILIPIVHEVLYFTAGPETAASVSTSLFVLMPVDVLILEPEPVPSNILDFLFYCVRPMGELLAFCFTFFSALQVFRKVKGAQKVYISLCIICIVTIALTILKGFFGYGIIALMVSLSGVGVAKIFSGCRPSSS
jgi:hypothetical protein